ncbi:hypothetical protein, partial [Mesorhizobium sp. M7A.F.Ca.US.008.03.1.1]|uniref:hypothetical protein n=1 Tax=Mesorhizobium sp. M7A.F.Ca.US.008.03.1.1 TaxID=2496742 RepID=UPI0019D2E8EB
SATRKQAKPSPGQKTQILSPQTKSKTARKAQSPQALRGQRDCRSFPEYAGWSEGCRKPMQQ